MCSFSILKHTTVYMLKP